MALYLTQATSPHLSHTHDDLKSALYNVLFGIQVTWKLPQSELAAILHRPESTVSDWKVKQTVNVSPEPSPNDLTIYELIEFYDSVSSMFARVNDQLQWLHRRSSDFAGESPIELLKKHPKNLYLLRDWLDRAGRP